MGSIPEDHGIEKSFGICIGELELPVAASVGGAIDAGLVAGTGGHEEGFVGGESDDAAKVERIGTGDMVRDPDVAISGAEVSAVRAGGPCGFLRHRAHAAEIFGVAGDAGLRSGLSEGGGGGEEKK